MITIKFDQQFQIDFKRISRRIPQIVTELEYVIEAIEEYGRVPESYNPHMLEYLLVSRPLLLPKKADRAF